MVVCGTLYTSAATRCRYWLPARDKALCSVDTRATLNEFLGLLIEAVLKTQKVSFIYPQDYNHKLTMAMIRNKEEKPNPSKPTRWVVDYSNGRFIPIAASDLEAGYFLTDREIAEQRGKDPGSRK
jgi:hypothetical protein